MFFYAMCFYYSLSCVTDRDFQKYFLSHEEILILNEDIYSEIGHPVGVNLTLRAVFLEMPLISFKI